MVPEGTNAYEQWFHQYLPNGLRRMELVYNKQQQLMVKWNTNMNKYLSLLFYAWLSVPLAASFPPSRRKN